ncbi:MAG: hypothetical protein IC227_00170 [Enterococcus lacertideformus]|uniref:Uncharacterized protein n=1 Tax=Enterococcus lacertideformus TaxID=2771493 RepID=A0A931AWZ3_9ENTE|nr:hypothetical protein [Enterococcus lacertideformus]
MNWFMSWYRVRKEQQIKNKIERYKEKVAQSREEYQNSTDYPLHMSHVFLQHLNFIPNSLGETEGFGTDHVIEWLALYKEMVQKYPE